MEQHEGTGLIPSGTKVAGRALPETAIFGTASTGTKQVGMSFEIISGPFKGMRQPWFGFFTDESRARTMESLIHAGCTFPDDDLGNLEGLGSKEVDLTIEINENPDNGNLTNRVAWVNAPGQVVMKEQFDEQETKAFAKESKADLLEVKRRMGLSKKKSPPKKDSATSTEAAPKA